jgi:DnaK suppressor protein
MSDSFPIEDYTTLLLQRHEDLLDRAEIAPASSFERTRRELQEIRDALLRIRQGRFGRCEQCADWIAQERLKARPAARVCRSCEAAAARPALGAPWAPRIWSTI